MYVYTQKHNIKLKLQINNGETKAIKIVFNGIVNKKYL